LWRASCNKTWIDSQNLQKVITWNLERCDAPKIQELDLAVLSFPVLICNLSNPFHVPHTTLCFFQIDCLYAFLRCKDLPHLFWFASSVEWESAGDFPKQETLWCTGMLKSVSCPYAKNLYFKHGSLQIQVTRVAMDVKKDNEKQ
jgi:hypothetical protein